MGGGAAGLTPVAAVVGFPGAFGAERGGVGLAVPRYGSWSDRGADCDWPVSAEIGVFGGAGFWESFVALGCSKRGSFTRSPWGFTSALRFRGIAAGTAPLPAFPDTEVSLRGCWADFKGVAVAGVVEEACAGCSSPPIEERTELRN